MGEHTQRCECMQRSSVRICECMHAPSLINPSKRAAAMLLHIHGWSHAALHACAAWQRSLCIWHAFHAALIPAASLQVLAIATVFQLLSSLSAVAVPKLAGQLVDVAIKADQSPDRRPQQKHELNRARICSIAMPAACSMRSVTCHQAGQSPAKRAPAKARAVICMQRCLLLHANIDKGVMACAGMLFLILIVLALGGVASGLRGW